MLLLEAADHGGAAQGASGDGLDGLRALYVAHWSRHPDVGATVRVRAVDDWAAAVLASWGLAPDPANGGLEDLAQPQQVTQPGLELHPAAGPGRAEVQLAVGEREQVVAGHRQPDVGLRHLGPVRQHVQITHRPRTEPTHDDLVEIGEPAGEAAVEPGGGRVRREVAEDPLRAIRHYPSWPRERAS